MATPFYNLGTATLTNGSTAMVGSGTLWLGNVRPYDQVVGKDGKSGFAAAVLDNTHITLMRPWAGTTQVADVYDILYTSDDPFTQQLGRTVLQSISASALIGLGELTPAGRKGVYFNSASVAALFDLSDAARTVLDDADIATMRATLGVALKQSSASDTTAGSGLIFGAFGIGTVLNLTAPDLNLDTRPSGVYYCNSPTNQPAGASNGWLTMRNLVPGYADQDYTDVSAGRRWTRSCIAAAWTAWLRVIGEYGSAVNGQYLRLPTGAQMCWGRVGPRNLNINGVGTTSGVFYSAVQSITFPAPFVASPSLVVNTAVGNLSWTASGSAVASTTGGSYYNLAASSETARSTADDWMAMGRWF